MVYAILTQKQREKFETDLELDCALHAAGPEPLPRERLPAARPRRRGAPRDPVRDRRLRHSSACPPSVRSSRDLPRGLVLVTGPTGSGKTTTLATLVDIVNRDEGAATS